MVRSNDEIKDLIIKLHRRGETDKEIADKLMAFECSIDVFGGKYPYICSESGDYCYECGINAVSKYIHDYYKGRVDLLNKLTIKDWSASNGEIEYIAIADNEENRSILKKLGAEETDFKEMKESLGDELDISSFAFKFADIFNPKKGFILYE